MAITLIDNQIQFSNITVPSVNIDGLAGNTNYKSTSGQSIDDEYEGEIQKPIPLINAVDIDWNGAKPGIGEDATNGITTTGELLSSIKGVYSPMFAS